MRLLASLALTTLLAGCALLSPLPKETSIDERLKAFPTGGLPLQGRVQVLWDDHQIPFIEAEHDEDAAFALGLVHAHLRLGQMAIYRKIAQGRIAEMGGPLAADIDHGLRILDFGKAAAESEAAMAPEARRWMERFVEGVNLYQDRLETLPYEYRALGLEREPWTVRDLLAFGRLSGTDVTWLVWFNLLQLRQRDDWPELWARLIDAGARAGPSFANRPAGAVDLASVLEGMARTGSNSIAIAPDRTTTGGAIIASDPHLGLNLPNTWILAGLKSPSYHAVGMMVPGLPVFAIGRNPDIAWGGTNMRSAASDLVDLSAVPKSEIRERRETIRVRGWLDREIVVRESSWGPVISDAPQFAELGQPPLALRWTGHRPSDEISAMLAVSRAGSFEEFRKAFADFSLPAQNMIYADAKGNIGRLMAVQLPARGNEAPADMLTLPAQSDAAWERILGSLELPFSYNPDKGFLASANNRPTDATDIRIGYFFSPGDRVERMAELVEGGGVSLEAAMALQQDVVMASSLALRDAFVAALSAAGIDAQTAEMTPDERGALELMAGWDGRYDQASRGAVAFEIFRAELTTAFYKAKLGADDWQAFADVGEIRTLLAADLAAADPDALRPLLRQSLAATAETSGDFAGWGEMHRLLLRHPLAFLPLIGGRFAFADLPAAGSSETLMKTAHGLVSERHRVRYGSNARHVSDMTDPDRNLFVLLGGQDGWLNSTTFLDQVPLWREGRYIELPLRPETVRERFPRTMTLAR